MEGEEGLISTIHAVFYNENPFQHIMFTDKFKYIYYKRQSSRTLVFTGYKSSSFLYCWAAMFLSCDKIYVKFKP